jgi:hypothetical protein
MVTTYLPSSFPDTRLITLPVPVPTHNSRASMPSKMLMSAWAFLDLCLLAAGVVSVALSIVWRAPNTLLNLVLTNADLTGAFLPFVNEEESAASYHILLSLQMIAGVVLGVFLLITFVFSIGAIVQRNHVTIGLVILNWLLIVDAIAILIIGTFVWFFTLRERDAYHKVWRAQTDAVKIEIQDKVCNLSY